MAPALLHDKTQRFQSSVHILDMDKSIVFANIRSDKLVTVFEYFLCESVLRIIGGCRNNVRTNIKTVHMSTIPNRHCHIARIHVACALHGVLGSRPP